MDIKLFDSELKVMDVLWKEGDTPAREIARVLTDELGWNVNTTYTLIKRCIKKGAIARSEPGFMRHALVSKSAVQEAETDELINKIYDGSADKLFAALLGRKKLSEEQIQKLTKQIKALRHEFYICADIEADAAMVQEKLRQAELAAQQERNEVKEDEYKRRSSRPDGARGASVFRGGY